MKFLLLFFVLSQTAWSYVPTVESLFRNGSNPDMNGNVAIVNLKVTKVDPSGIVQDEKNSNSEYFRIYYTRSSDDVVKLNQFKFPDQSFNEDDFVHRTYYSNFNAFTLANQPSSVEKSLFYGVMQSLVLQDGQYLVNYLKSKGLPLRLNKEIINREKINLLAQYKQYLVTINQDKEARKTLENPLRPNSADKREHVEKVMNESMYVDTQHVVLAKEGSDMSWKVSAGGFDASVSYDKRYLQKLGFKGENGDIEFIFKDYGLVNATHVLPRFILIRDFNGDNYQVEVLNLRYASLNDASFVKKLREWDQKAKARNVEVLRPSFLL